MKNKEVWKSSLGFILAGLGMAVGCGNIWRFPRVAAKYGGGTFVLVFFIALFIWSLPLLMVEMVMGRKTRKGVVGAFRDFVGPRYTWMGAWIGFVCLAIACYYSVVSGWCLKYLTLSFTGFKSGLTPAKAWQGFISGYQPIFFHFIAICIGAFIVARGIQRGIEILNKIFLPILFFLMVFLTIRGICLKGGFDGVKYLLFSFDYQGLKNPALWMEAFAQSAWSTGAGWGLWLTYSTYTDSEKDNVTKSCFWVGMGDVLASILAGLVVLTTIFGVIPDPETRQNVLKAGNQGLTFEWLVTLFKKMPGGLYTGIFFFCSLFFAAMSSLIALLELGVKILLDAGMSRKKACICIFVFIFAFGIPSAISMKFFNNQDWVWGMALLVSGLFFAFAAIKKGVESVRKDYIDNKEDKEKKIAGYIYKTSLFFVISALLFYFVYKNIDDISKMVSLAAYMPTAFLKEPMLASIVIINSILLILCLVILYYSIFFGKKLWWNLSLKIYIPIFFFELVIWWFFDCTKWEKIAWYNPLGIYTPANVLLQWAVLIIILITTNKYMAKIFETKEIASEEQTES